MRHLLALCVALVATSASAEVLLSEVVTAFDLSLPEGEGPYDIQWSFGQIPNEPGTTWTRWRITEDIGAKYRAEIAPDAYVNGIYGLETWDAFMFDSIRHHFRWATNREIVDREIRSNQLLVTGDYNFDVTSHIVPPNGFSLFGTGLHFTAVEFTLDALTTIPDQSVAIAGTFRYFGAVPEPSTAVLLLLLVLSSPLRCRVARHG